MLTRDLLQYRIRDAQARPSFIDPKNPELLAVAEAMVAAAEAATGVERGIVEERLKACAAVARRPRIAEGFAKLVLDRMEFEEASAEAPVLRKEAFDAAAQVLRSMPENATQAEFELHLASAVSMPLPDLRERLYADHPENRPLVSWKPLTAEALLQRWNLAQVQGLLMEARRVEIRASNPDLLRVRRVFRWLKFCRLVADVSQIGDEWVVAVEGPAEVLDMHRKYGLQLAMFAAVIPVLERWTLRADIKLRAGRTVTLALDESSGLVSPHDHALGWVPEEIAVIARKLEGGEWALDTTPQPRAVGVSGFCVPDLSLRRQGVTLYFEFFHRWHRHQLARRLEDLRTRPDPELFLAVDEHLLRDEEMRAQIEAHPQAMTFKGFPSERRIRQVLARFEQTSGD